MKWAAPSLAVFCYLSGSTVGFDVKCLVIKLRFSLTKASVKLARGLYAPALFLNRTKVIRFQMWYCLIGCGSLSGVQPMALRPSYRYNRSGNPHEMLLFGRHPH